MITRYLPIFIILSILAEILGTIGGFGSSVFFVPIANMFFDFQSVLGITALYHLSSNVTKIAFFKKQKSLEQWFSSIRNRPPTTTTSKVR